jgi:hypothetical protein
VGMGMEECGPAHPAGAHIAGHTGAETISGCCYDSGHKTCRSSTDAIGGEPSFSGSAGSASKQHIRSEL